MAGGQGGWADVRSGWASGLMDTKRSPKPARWAGKILADRAQPLRPQPLPVLTALGIRLHHTHFTDKETEALWGRFNRLAGLSGASEEVALLQPTSLVLRHPSLPVSSIQLCVPAQGTSHGHSGLSAASWGPSRINFYEARLRKVEEEQPQCRLLKPSPTEWVHRASLLF